MKTFTRFMLVAVLSAWPYLASADPAEPYGKGLEAMANQNWGEAADWFREAISENPTSGGRIRAAGGRTRYVPYFQLGRALYEAGEFEGASVAWRQALLQDALGRSDKKLIDELQWEIERQRQDSPQEGVAPSSSAALSPEEAEQRSRSIQKQLDRARRLLAAVDDVSLFPAFDVDPLLTARLDLGKKKLEEAESIFEEAAQGVDSAAYRAAHARSVAAADDFFGVLQEATILVEELEGEFVLESDQPTGGPSAADVETVSSAPVEEADRVETPPPTSISDSSEIEAESEPEVAMVDASPGVQPNLVAEDPDTNPDSLPEAASSGPEAASSSEPSAQPDPEAETALAALETDRAEPPDLPSVDAPEPPGDETDKGSGAPPRFLREAAIALFTARYEDALDLLEVGDDVGPRALKHVHLFRAASFFALSRFEESPEGDLLQKARAEVKKCRELDASLRPSLEAFSPAFVDFFDK